MALARAAMVGVSAFSVALAAGLTVRAWEAFLVNFVFWIGIAQGGIAVSAALYLTQARWGGAGAYRLAESFFWYLPVGFGLFWLILFGRTIIFPWVLHPVPQKASWLNVPFMFSRDGLGLLLMAILSYWFVNISRRREVVTWANSYDNIQRPPSAVFRLAPILLIAYAFIYTMLAFDLVMSL